MMYLPPLRGFVRVLAVICAIVFGLQCLLQVSAINQAAGGFRLERFFGLVPEMFFKGWLTQAFTWIFLHASFMHLVFNLLALWLFGSQLEDAWGRSRFTRFIFISAGLTALLVACFALIFNDVYSVPTIGASGVIFAILLATGVLFPNQVVLFFFVFPMKMRYFALLMVLIEFSALWQSNSHGVSNTAHLSGALIGYLLARFGSRSGPRSSMTSPPWWQVLREKWHQRRMRKRLRVIRMPERITYH